MDLIGASLGEIEALVVFYDKATSSVKSSVDDQLDRGRVLWMQWIICTHNKVVCRVDVIDQD